MKIAVTGANGLVGSRVCRALESHGHLVLGLGRGDRRIDGNFDYASVELTDAGRVEDLLKGFLPEVIVHTASMTEVDACEKSPEVAYAINGHVPALLSHMARKQGSHLVHVSTDYVFDGDHGPYDEEALPNPRGVYAVTKYMGELAVRTLAPSWSIARTAVVYGWPAHGRPNFGSWLVGTLNQGQAIKLFSDQWVSPTLASNVAQMVAELAVRKLPGVWHTAGAEVIDRVAFGYAVCDRFGFDRALITPTRMADLKLASPRPSRSGLATQKAAQALTCGPLDLKASLDQFYSEFKGAVT